MAPTPEQKRLRRALDRAERSAAWLARQVGVSDMTMSRWLGRAKSDHGQRVPERMREPVAKALGVPATDLFPPD